MTGVTRRKRLAAAAKRFWRREDGATAVEFALVAAPFCLLIFSLLELALVYLVSVTLDQATLAAARTIRTGELQKAGGATQSTFRDAICANMTWLASSCPSQLSVDVRTFTNFQNVNPPNPVSNGVFNPAVLTFQPGGPSDIVVVRAYYQWPLITPFLQQALKSLKNGGAVVSSNMTFRNEPYAVTP